MLCTGDDARKRTERNYSRQRAPLYQAASVSYQIAKTRHLGTSYTHAIRTHKLSSHPHHLLRHLYLKNIEKLCIRHIRCLLLKVTKLDFGRKPVFHALTMLEYKPQQTSMSGSELQEEQRRKLDELTPGCLHSSFLGGN